MTLETFPFVRATYVYVQVQHLTSCFTNLIIIILSGFKKSSWIILSLIYHVTLIEELSNVCDVYVTVGARLAHVRAAAATPYAQDVTRGAAGVHPASRSPRGRQHPRPWPRIISLHQLHSTQDIYHYFYCLKIVTQKFIWSKDPVRLRINFIIIIRIQKINCFRQFSQPSSIYLTEFYDQASDTVTAET